MNWVLFQNSLFVAGLSTVLAVVFGLSAALWLAGLPRRWRKLFFAVAIIDLALPPFLVTNCWLHFLGDTGVWRSWLPFSLFSLGGTIWILAVLLWPITLVTVSSAWRRLEPAQLESDTAVTGWALCRALLFPIARTALGQAAVLTFVLAINNFAVPAILQVKVSPAEMWIRFNTAFDTVGALKLSWPLLAGPLVLLVWLSRRGIPWPHRQPTVSPQVFRQQLGPALFWLCGCASLFLVFVSIVLPILQLITVSRTWTELPGAVAAGQAAIWNSFWFAAVAASAIVVIAFLGRQNRRLALPRKRGVPSGIRNAAFTRLPIVPVIANWVLWLPFLLPGVLLGIGLIAVFNRPAWTFFYQSSGIVILAFVIRYFALGRTAIAHAVQSADGDLSDVARLEGATRWQSLRQVLWPQIGPQVLGAWYLVFLLCLWEVESMILVVPPGDETLALRIFNLLHYGHNAQVNALCLVLLALALLPLLGWASFCAVRGKALRLTLLAGALLCFAAGCNPPPASNTAPIESKIFSEVQIIGHRGVGVGELNKPRSVAVDDKDNLYVTDMTGRVQKFSSNGVFLLSWQLPQTDKGKPKGMCNDRQGGIVVNEPHYSRVNHFSTEGKLLVQWGVHGTNEGLLTFPRSVAVNSRHEIYVSEYGLVERVQRFTTRGEKFIGSFGHAGTGPGEFNRAEGLFIDSQDRVYVADSCNHRIQIFSSEGHFIRTYGKPGRGLGELSYPYDICVDADGRQYVCEFGNSRIQIFDAHDQPIEIIGGPGTEPGQFGNPWGVALDSAGNLYVADSQNHRVQKFIRKRDGNGTDRKTDSSKAFDTRKAVVLECALGSARLGK